jgi:LacI family repressor for deo operon, udp, cdd, tsx, nupC, and nupG
VGIRGARAPTAHATVTDTHTTPSMHDVAQLAGVSAATVSRALHGRPGVADSTRDRVLAAAESLSYTLSPIASRLASGRTHTVGVLVPHAARWRVAQTVAGAESVLREHALDVLLYDIGEPEARERFFTQLPLRRRVDAVLAVAMLFTEAEARSLRELDVPVAVVGTALPGAWSVRIDERAAVHTALEHLRNLGHHRIGMIATDGDARRRAYRDLSGPDVDEDLLVVVPHGLDGGRDAMRRLLRLPAPPTAVITDSDELAFGALSALRAAGKNVALVGLDDHELSGLLDLTTVRQRASDQGCLAAGMLLRAMATDARDPEDVILPTALVQRASTWPV